MTPKSVLLFIPILLLFIPYPAFCQSLLPGETTLNVSGPIIVSFKAWLGANHITLGIGKEGEVRLYVLNLGNGVDSYTIDTNSSGVVKVSLTNNISEVYPQDVKFTPLLISSTKKIENEAVKFEVCSQREPNICENVTLTVTTFIPQSLPEMSDVILTFLLVASIIIFKVV